MRIRQPRNLFACVLATVTAVGCGSSAPPAPAAAGGAAGGTGGRGGNAASAATGGAGGAAGSGDAGPSAAGGAAGAPVTDSGAAAPTPDLAGPAPDTQAASDAVDASGAAGSNPAPGDYGTRATLLERNSEFALAALDGKVYVLGGYPTNPAQTRPTLQIYDPQTNSWRLGMPAPMAVHHPVMAGVAGKLYSLGGQPNTDLVYEYDPAANSWRPRARMPTARGGGAAAVLGNKIYVVGARPSVAPEAANALEVYDVVADTWDTLPPLPMRTNYRNHLAAAGIAGKIYVAGGRYDECCVAAPMTAALDVFDPATAMWTSKKAMPRPRGGVAGVAANGCFHVYGGEGSNIGEPGGVFPDHDVYNPLTDTWTTLKKLPIPFHGVTGGALVDGLIYMPGGGTSSGGSSGTTMHQVYRPDLRCE